MKRTLSVILLLVSGAVWAAQPTPEPVMIVKPEAFQTLVHPNCSHCAVEANRRKKDLRADDRVLCWVQVQNDGYVNDGVIPIRFFLNTYRVLSDSWGVFVYDPDAGFARGFSPAAGPFRFHGWRNGVMVMKGEDGTLYSTLTGIAFDGPRKGSRLEPVPTLVTDWGFWEKRYPAAVAYWMYDKFKPIDLPTATNEDSVKSRGPLDTRLPPDTPVLGVWDGKRARAYPIELLAKAGVIHDIAGDPRVVLWCGPTRTAAAFRQPWGTSGLAGDAGWVFSIDPKQESAPFADKRTGLHWDITGRAAGGGPRLAWLDSVQVKWYAWAAEHPQTTIYGQESAANPIARTDYKPLSESAAAIAGPHGNLDAKTRHFAILKAADANNHRVMLMIEGESEPRNLPLRPGTEIWCAGSWGRLDQFKIGDRVWAWFEMDQAKQPLGVTMLADELSEQYLYAPFQVKSVDLQAANHGAVTLESARANKPVLRTIALGSAERYCGSVKAPQTGLKVGDTVFVQTTGDDARLILDSSAFEMLRARQNALLRKRWSDEGVLGDLIFSHPDRHEIEVMMGHEYKGWGRSLAPGDNVLLCSPTRLDLDATVRQIRPWRERIQVLLQVDGSDQSGLQEGARVSLRKFVKQGLRNNSRLPATPGKAVNYAERLEWLMSSIYCTCGMHDECAGHFYTLAACNAGPNQPCGNAKATRQLIAAKIAQGQTDRQIIEDLLKERGPKLLRPHMLP